MDPHMDLTNQFGVPNPNLVFSNDNFLTNQQSNFPAGSIANLHGFSFTDNANVMPVGCSLPCAQHFHPDIKEQKVSSASDARSENSSLIANVLDGNSSTKKNSNSGRGKRGRKDMEAQPKEVIHVRARRGQATDSHSLAERVRREKINEKLKCLQDLVPGCYKSMGMTLMLDEIILYVQSLKNQVEFLSMKLTTASSFYDFNSNMEATQTMLGADGCEVQEMERLNREVGGYGGRLGSSTHDTTWHV